MRSFTTVTLSNEISGKLYGPDRAFTGIFNTLGDSQVGDVVIRHWIDSNGIKMAHDRGVCSVITQELRGDAAALAAALDFPVIVVDKIEIASAFALKWAINKFASNSHRLVVTGTNGKSTTTHMIFHILKTSGKSVFTNTDSKSEFNTLIDPLVSKLISEFYLDSNHIKSSNSLNDDYLIIEVSEVQGWLDKIMQGHAFLMTQAINPEVVVITNVALDHIGLVDSIEDSFNEISGAVKALQRGYAVLNSDDPMVLRMAQFISPGVQKTCYGSNSNLYSSEKGIYYEGKLILERDKLPFKSSHFIENTLSAVAACIALKISLKNIKKGVYSYKPLERRFSILNHSPRIIDDFAHNPDGIQATIKSAAQSTSNQLWILCAIRGSRGTEINLHNAKALSHTIKELISHENSKLKIRIYLTSSRDVVDQLNTVTDQEKEIFLDTLNKNELNYKFFENLEDSLQDMVSNAHDEDTLLLIGAQGMDPASEILHKLI